MRSTREENTNALVMKKLLVLGHLNLYNWYVAKHERFDLTCRNRSKAIARYVYMKKLMLLAIRWIPLPRS